MSFENSQQQNQLEDSNVGLRYSSYEDPKSFAPYQILLLGTDFIFNWIIDWAHTDPLAILVIFVFQCLGLLVNLIIYIMASASQAMQSGLRKSIVYHHQVNLLTLITYFILTCSWYIWALRKSWPSVSDQFSFSFSSDTIFPEDNSANPHPNEDVSRSTEMPTSLSTTLSPILSTLVTKSVNKTISIKRLLYQSRYDKVEEMMESNSQETKVVREFYTLWSPGFVALYVIQRTVAIIYYWISLKATYLVLNASTIDNLDKINYPERDETKKTTNSMGRASKSNPTDQEADERDSSDSEIDEGGQKNFRNNCEILWSKKGFSPDGGGDGRGKIVNPPRSRNSNSIFNVESYETLSQVPQSHSSREVSMSPNKIGNKDEMRREKRMMMM